MSKTKSRMVFKVPSSKDSNRVLYHLYPKKSFRKQNKSFLIQKWASKIKYKITEDIPHQNRPPFCQNPRTDTDASHKCTALAYALIETET